VLRYLVLGGSRCLKCGAGFGSAPRGGLTIGQSAGSAERHALPPPPPPLPLARLTGASTPTIRLASSLDRVHPHSTAALKSHQPADRSASGQQGASQGASRCPPPPFHTARSRRSGTVHPAARVDPRGSSVGAGGRGELRSEKCDPGTSTPGCGSAAAAPRAQQVALAIDRRRPRLQRAAHPSHRPGPVCTCSSHSAAPASPQNVTWRVSQPGAVRTSLTGRERWTAPRA